MHPEKGSPGPCPVVNLREEVRDYMECYKNEEGLLKCFGMPGDWRERCQGHFHCAQLSEVGDCDESTQKTCWDVAGITKKEV